MTPNQSKLPSAVFIGFAAEPGALPAGARDKLLGLITPEAGFPKPELTLPVGSGVVLCFDFPTRTLEFVRLLGARVRAPNWPLPAVQMGVHIATMSRSADNPEATVSGGSIDGAARAARFAEPNQAVATSHFQTLVVQLLKMDQGHFKPLGRLTGRDGKSIEGFEIPPFAAGAASKAELTGIPATLVTFAEKLLANEIGPLAKLVVRQTADAQLELGPFIEKLSQSIPDAAQRQTFSAALKKAANA